MQLFKRGCCGCRLDELFPDAGEFVRIYSLGTKGEKTQSEAWAAALLVNPDLSTNTELAHSHFWINYYGPEIILPAVSLYKALADNDPEVPSGFFSNKVVFVGSKLQTHLDSERKDEYSTPYSSRVDNRWMSGVSIHATAFLNLIRSDWLRQFSSPMEIAALICFGLAFGGGLIFFRPVTATILPSPRHFRSRTATTICLCIISIGSPGLFLSPHRYPLGLFGRSHSTPSKSMWRNKRWNNRSAFTSRPGW